MMKFSLYMQKKKGRNAHAANGNDAENQSEKR